MPRLNQKRGRALIVLGLAEFLVGAAYVFIPTQGQLEALAWLPWDGRAIGFLAMASSVMAVAAGPLSARSLRWDIVGWKAAMATPLTIAAVWFVTGTGDLVDGPDAGTDPAGSLLTAVVYVLLSALVWVLSDWPNPVVDPGPPGPPFDDKGGR